MAVQKSKKSRAKRNIRRSANTLVRLACLSTNKYTNEVHIRHFITKSGFYKDKQIILKKNKEKT